MSTLQVLGRRPPATPPPSAGPCNALQPNGAALPRHPAGMRLGPAGRRRASTRTRPRGIRGPRRRQDRLRGRSGRRAGPAHRRPRRPSTRSRTAGPGRRRCPTWRGDAARHHDRPAGQRPLRPPARRRAAYDVRRLVGDTARGDGRDSVSSRAVLVGALHQRLACACSPPPLHPDRVLGVVAIAPAPRRPPESPPRPDRAVDRFRRARWTTDEGWAKFNRALLAARLGRVRRVLLRRAVPSEPHSTKQRRGRGRPGRCESDPRGAVADVDAGAVAGDGADDRGAAHRRSGARCWSCTAPRTGASRTSAAPGWPS